MQDINRDCSTNLSVNVQPILLRCLCLEHNQCSRLTILASGNAQSILLKCLFLVHNQCSTPTDNVKPILVAMLIIFYLDIYGRSILKEQ